MILVLFRGEGKEKIKSNSKNIVNYLKAPDLWEKNIYNDEKFNEDLDKLKKINIKVNQIIWLYNYLAGNKQEKNQRLQKIKKKSLIINNTKEEEEDKSNIPENIIEEAIIISAENDDDNEIELKEK